jgi:hypothetical protein
MYTLFQSISNTLPQTAYLKLIDLWLLFSLIVPLIIFIIHMIWEMRSSKGEMIQTNEKPTGTAWISTTNQALAKKGFTSRRAVQIMVPLASALFIIVYWAYALNIY